MSALDSLQGRIVTAHCIGSRSITGLLSDYLWTAEGRIASLDLVAADGALIVIFGDNLLFVVAERPDDSVIEPG